jgi:hypothetical protein
MSSVSGRDSDLSKPQPFQVLGVECRRTYKKREVSALSGGPFPTAAVARGDGSACPFCCSDALRCGCAKQGFLLS